MRKHKIIVFLVIFLVFLEQFAPHKPLAESESMERYDESYIIDVLKEYTQISAQFFMHSPPASALKAMSHKIDAEKFLNSIIEDAAYAEFWPDALYFYFDCNKRSSASAVKRLLDFTKRPHAVYTPFIRKSFHTCYLILHKMLHDPNIFNENPALKTLLVEDYAQMVIDENLCDPQSWIQRFHIGEGKGLYNAQLADIVEFKIKVTPHERETLYEAVLIADTCSDSLVYLYLLTQSSRMKEIIDRCKLSEFRRIRDSMKHLLSEDFQKMWRSGELLRIRIIP